MVNGWGSAVTLDIHGICKTKDKGTVYKDFILGVSYIPWKYGLTILVNYSLCMFAMYV